MCLLYRQLPPPICPTITHYRQAGFALVLVLWILSLLTIMAGSFALTMRRESTVIASVKDNAGAVALAEAGVTYAEFMLLNPEQNKRWRADGNIYLVDFGDNHVRIRMLSESGKIDINKAGQPLLQALFANSQLDEEKQGKLIGAILDWRDPDDLINLNGAEKDQYKKEGLKYGPRNKPFQTLDELQMVLGMDAEVFNWLEPYVTVYSGKPQVNFKLATPKVLNILPGLDAGLIESFITTRLENAKNDMPAPEFAGGLTGTENSGGAITIISDALMADSTSALVVATVMKSDTTGELPDEAEAGSDADAEPPYIVLKWQHNPLNEKTLFTDEMTELLVKQYAEPELSD